MARIIDRSEVSLCIKYFLFFLNFIFFLIGLAATAVGAYVLNLKEKVFRSFIDAFDPSFLLCLGGSIVILVSLFGIIGSLREITICLTLYYGLIMFFIVLQLAIIVGAFLFYYVPSTRSVLQPEEALKDAIVHYREDVDRQNLIDWWQVEFKCCGVSNDDIGYKDWNANMYFNCTENTGGPRSPESCSVPWSCCRLVAGEALNYQCGGNTLQDGASTSKIYTKGCLKGLVVWIEQNALLFGGALIGILVPEVILVYLGSTMKVQIETQLEKWKRTLPPR